MARNPTSESFVHGVVPHREAHAFVCGFVPLFFAAIRASDDVRSPCALFKTMWMFLSLLTHLTGLILLPSPPHLLRLLLLPVPHSSPHRKRYPNPLHLCPHRRSRCFRPDPCLILFPCPPFVVLPSTRLSILVVLKFNSVSLPIPFPLLGTHITT